jgi:hypothetical protein
MYWHALIESFDDRAIKNPKIPRSSATYQRRRTKCSSGTTGMKCNSEFISPLGVFLLLALFATADAQQPKKVSQLGYLAAGAARSGSSRVETFRQGVQALGYEDGKDLVISLS